MKKIEIVIPTTPNDLATFSPNWKTFFNCLPVEKICLIGNSQIVNYIKYRSSLCILDESNILSYEVVESCIKKRTSDYKAIKRTGWYLQQFLKMAYARQCSEEYYLLWDSDTVPLKRIVLFNSFGIPFLDFKSEYNKAYFETIAKILPGYNKVFSGSFIAEHMLINTKLMCELLEKIESNNSIPGTFFYEKIINAISIEDLAGSGFSEFETYGTFIQMEYPEKYQLRKWYSLRYGGFYFLKETNIEEISNWLSIHYDAISFEKLHKLSHMHVLVNNKAFRYLFSPSILDYLSIPIRIKRKLFLYIHNILNR